MANELREVASLLGLRASVHGATDLIPLIRRGLSVSALEALSKHVDLSVLQTGESLGLTRRTLARRLEKHQRLDSEQSERVVRLARVVAASRLVFGNAAKALAWLKKSNRVLGATPLSLLDTDIGANAVLDEIGRIDHGVFA